MKTFKITIPTMGDLADLICNYMNLREWFKELKADQQLLQRRIVTLEHGAPAGIVEKVDAIATGLGSKADSLRMQEEIRRLDDRISRCEYNIANPNTDRMTALADRVIDLEIRLKDAEASIPVGTHSWQKEDGADVYACKFCRKALEPNAQDFSLCMGKPKL